MTEFEAAIDSLGIWSVNNLPGVESVRLTADESDRTVEMEIVLSNDAWSSRERIIDLMVEVRVMYLNDFSISYRFGDADGDESMTQPGVRSLQFAV